MGATQELARYVAGTSYEDLPAEVKEMAKICLLDWFGVTLGGATEDLSPILQKLAAEMGGEKQATVIGAGLKTNVLLAALVNGSISHALDFDDAHAGSFAHPTVTVAPAVLAVAEYKRASGRDLITAFVLGFEVETRIGIAAGRAHYDKGWHATSTTGRFGGAAGAARLLGMDEGRLVNALGIAGTQTGGVRQVFGTMCKPFHAGKAAMDGVLAAYLAGMGFTSSNSIVEGKFGFLEIFSPEPKAEKLTDGLGRDYTITSVGFKPYASCAGTHTVIDAIRDIRATEKLSADEVAEIDLELAKLSLDAAGIVEPRTALEGKFSVYHCAALALLEGEAGEDRFTDEKVNDPKIVSLRKKVKARLNPDFKLLDTRVAVVTNDGRRIERFLKIPKGQPENKMTQAEMEEKFRGLASRVMPRDNISRLLEKINKLEEVSDVGEITALCAVR
ncbi:MAG: MmgE/PrpD family protein [Bacillota bacterium]